jgi:hypothetical protein
MWWIRGRKNCEANLSGHGPRADPSTPVQPPTRFGKEVDEQAPEPAYPPVYLSSAFLAILAD